MRAEHGELIQFDPDRDITDAVQAGEYDEQILGNKSKPEKDPQGEESSDEQLAAADAEIDRRVQSGEFDNQIFLGEKSTEDISDAELVALDARTEGRVQSGQYDAEHSPDPVAQAEQILGDKQPNVDVYGNPIEESREDADGNVKEATG